MSEEERQHSMNQLAEGENHFITLMADYEELLDRVLNL